MKIDIRQHVHRCATRYGLSRSLVAAIAQVESAGNPHALRVETGYRWLWNVRSDEPLTLEKPTMIPRDFPAPRFVTRATEFWQQKTSWGVMQVMGAVARELGAKEPYLAALTDPERGIEIGCKFLVSLHRRFGEDHGWAGVVAAYNAGRPAYDDAGAFINQGYVDKVREHGGLPP